MRIPLPPVRGLVMLVVTVGFVVAAIDAGSVVMNRMTVPDDVRAAGHAAAEVAKNQPATRQTALAAYEAAVDDARQTGITVQTKGFTLYPDGRVTLTAGKTAPTLLLDRIAALRDLAEVRTTVTVEPLPFS